MINFLNVKKKILICLKYVCLHTGLQTTRLGTYIEDRVNKYLKRQNHPEAGEVFVRVVASSDKMVDVKPGMKSRWDPNVVYTFYSFLFLIQARLWSV